MGVEDARSPSRMWVGPARSCPAILENPVWAGSRNDPLCETPRVSIRRRPPEGRIAVGFAYALRWIFTTTVTKVSPIS